MTHFTVDSRGYEGAVYTVVLKATNREGHKSEELLTFSIDNTSPHLKVLKSAVSTNGKDSAGITVCADKELRRAGSSIIGYRQDNNGLCISLNYDDLPCGVAHPVRIWAEDLAGNTEEINAFLGCETGAPAIIPTQSLFKNDLDGAIIDLGEAGWGTTQAVIRKFYNKFDLVEETDDSAAQNLPVIKFRVDLPNSESILKQNYSVSYRYTYNGYDVEEGEWRSMQESESGIFELPLSYQTLLPPQYNEMMITVARLNNFLVQSKFNDAHRIEFKVVDEMGNEQVKIFDFNLELKSPPLYLSNCGATPAFASSRYEDLHHLESQSEPFFTPQVRWEVPRPKNSMAPDPYMNIEVSSLGSGYLRASKARVWVNLDPNEEAPARITTQAEACFEKKKMSCVMSIQYVDGRCTCIKRFQEELKDVDFPLGKLEMDSVSLEIQGSGQSVDVPIHSKLLDIFNLNHTMKFGEWRPEWVYSAQMGIPITLKGIQHSAKEMVTMPSISLRYPGLKVELVNFTNGIPPPHKVIRDESCRALDGQGGVLNWNSDND